MGQRGYGDILGSKSHGINSFNEEGDPVMGAVWAAS
jgi:hypothetical protein